MSDTDDDGSETGELPQIIVGEPLAGDAIFVDSRSDRRLPIGALGAVIVAIIALLALLARLLPEESTIAEPVPAGAVVRPTVAPATQPTDWLSTWPDPPDDHAPIVIGSPGVGAPLAAEPAGHTLVYVNSIDRPTIIDLVRGARQELTISTERNVDFFLVEDGQVVDDDPLNPDLPTAGARAVPVFVHRTTDAAPREIEGPSPYSGPHLCLDASGCDDIWWYPSTLSSGGQRVEQVAIGTSEELEGLFDSAALEVNGRFLLVDVGADSEVKVPIPRAGTTIWVIADRG